MRTISIRYLALCVLLLFGLGAFAQEPWTWEKVRVRVEQNNPTLQAGRLSIDESKSAGNHCAPAAKPEFNADCGSDRSIRRRPTHGPLAYFLPLVSVNYLYERDHKRDLRLESAQKTTAIAISTQTDLERTLLFNARTAFVDTLQAKAVLDVTKENLTYYDHLLEVSRERLQAGDIAQIDLDRLELQRVQYESDLQAAEVNLRTAKIHCCNCSTSAHRLSNSISREYSISTAQSFPWNSAAKLPWKHAPI